MGNKYKTYYTSGLYQLQTIVNALSPDEVIVKIVTERGGQTESTQYTAGWKNPDFYLLITELAGAYE